MLNINDFYRTLKALNENRIFEEAKDNRECIKITQGYAYWGENGHNQSEKGYLNIKFKEGVQYTFSGYAYHNSNNPAILSIYYTDGTYKDIGILPGEWRQFRFTSIKGKTIRGIYSTATTDTYAYIDKNTFIIEEGTQLTPFEPYSYDKKEILLPFTDGLKGLPNEVKDIIYNKENGCYVKQRVKKTIINDKSDIGLYNETVNKKRNRITFVVLHYNKLYNTGIMCDKLPHVFLGDMNATGTIGIDFYTESGWNENNFYITLERDKLGIVENDEQLQIIQKIKNWLKTNPLEVFYELADAIETKISDTKISLDTYNLLTHIFTDNTISPNIKLKVDSNLGSIIQQNAKSINDIYKLIDEVLIPQITTNTADIAILKLK